MVFASGFRLLMLQAVAIGKRRATLKDTTFAQYHADLERRLDKLLSGLEPKQQSARRLVPCHATRPRRSVALRDAP